LLRISISMKKCLIALSSVAWLALMLWGFKYVLDYDTKASAQGQYLSNWPATANIERAADRWTLVMVVHRQCPCTRASINELNRILAQCRGKLAVQMLLYRPAGAAGWTKGSVAQSVASLASVHSVDDPDGVTASLFNATTSGECFLYDLSGTLRFHGGITGSRGHEGDNDGEDLVVALVNGKIEGFQQSAYFGCLIH
jgi:hypothetical protein